MFDRDVLIDAVAGFVAGASVTVAFQPVDTVLTRQQYAAVPASAGATALELLRGKGGLAFWRGATPLVALVPLQNALLMMGYGYGERWGRALDRGDVAAKAGPSAAGPIFVGGCVGGLAQSFVASPLELAKVRRQLFQTPPDTRALSRGLTATFHRDVVPHGVWFLVYDRAKNVLTRGAAADEEDWTAPVAAGAVAATVAWLVGYPADLLKTRIQGAASPLSLSDAARDVLRREPPGLVNAVSALYRGLGLKLARAVPSSMVNFGVYEWAKARLEKM